MAAEPGAAGPDLRTALAELTAAESAVSGPALAREFQQLLRDEPGTLYRSGGPRHLTASAVVVDAPAEHVALVWHRKGRFWVQPGGHLEAGETSFAQAALREAAEEIGLAHLELVGEGPALLHRHGLDAAFGACAEHWDVLHLLRAPAPAAELALTASEETPEVIWVPWPLRDGTGPGRSSAALPAGAVPDLPSTLEALAPALSR